MDLRLNLSGKITRLQKDYHTIQPRIIQRLDEFARIWEEGSEETLFKELLFCLLTPQAKAFEAAKTIEILEKENLIWAGSAEETAPHLIRVRFKNNKAKNIVAAREKLIENGKPVLKRILSGFPDVFSRRDWLVANIRGMGYKEGSHFLRNIGMGENLAILDRHVFTHMLRLEIIPEKPASLSPKRYLELEEKLRQFARKAEIPLAHLDILFWYLETGAIFK